MAQSCRSWVKAITKGKRAIEGGWFPAGMKMRCRHFGDGGSRRWTSLRLPDEANGGDYLIMQLDNQFDKISFVVGRIGGQV